MLASRVDTPIRWVARTAAGSEVDSSPDTNNTGMSNMGILSVVVGDDISAVAVAVVVGMGSSLTTIAAVTDEGLLTAPLLVFRGDDDEGSAPLHVVVPLLGGIIEAFLAPLVL